VAVTFSFGSALVTVAPENFRGWPAQETNAI
jgi:hypothetical protein